MSSNPLPSDPWETPPAHLDPLVETSQQLMAKVSSTNSEPMPEPQDEKDLLIAQLEREKQQFFNRNVGLVAEAARLRVENQHLRYQLSELKQHQSQSWLARFFQRLSRR